MKNKLKTLLKDAARIEAPSRLDELMEPLLNRPSLKHKQSMRSKQIALTLRISVIFISCVLVVVIIRYHEFPVHKTAQEVREVSLDPTSHVLEAAFLHNSATGGSIFEKSNLVLLKISSPIDQTEYSPNQ